MKNILLFTFFFSLAAKAQSIDATIAQEFLLDGKLAKAISTCEKGLKDDPDDIDCKDILKKARTALVKKKQTESINIAREKEEQMARAKELAAKRTSGDCIKAQLLNKYCRKLLHIGIQQNLIDREKRVAKDTGTVNLRTINQAGSNKAILEDQLNEIKTSLRSKAVEVPSPGDCNIKKNQYGFPEEFEHPFGKNVEKLCGE